MECKGDEWVFKERGSGRCFQIELHVFTETKMKDNREVSWCGVNGFIPGAQEIERVSEGVAVLMNDI